MNQKWTDEMTAQLRQFHADKWTLNRAAEALGVSRDAVAGKLKRMGLSRPENSPIKTVRHRLMKAERNAALLLGGDDLSKPLAMKLRPRKGGCRYIYDGYTGEEQYCGRAPINQRSSWCEHHHAVTHMNPKAK